MDESEIQSLMELLARGWLEERQTAIAVAMGEAERFGIDFDLLVKAIGLAPELDAINELSGVLQKASQSRQIAEAKGEVQLSANSDLMGNALINFMAAAMLRNCCTLKVPAPYELLDVIERQLNVESFGKKQARQHKKETIAMLMLARNPEMSTSEIANELGVNKSTVSRWMRDDIFMSDLEAVRRDAALMAIIPQVLQKQREESETIRQLIDKAFPSDN